MATIENFIVRVSAQGVEQLSKLGSTADAVSGKMTALSGAILGVGFGAFIKGALESADKMVDLSDATGLTVASIKAFSESMRLAGGDSKGTERAIMSLYGAIEAAADGGLKQQQAFDKVGVSIKDLQDLSEADILQKTIEGLAKIPAGSERAATATALLGRSFRSVEAQKFLETLDPQQFLIFEANAKKAADTIERFENLFGILEEGVLRALDPFLDYMERIKFSAEDAERGFKIFGGILAVVFGAKMISSIIALNNALKITAGLSLLLGKSPLGAVAKLSLGAAAGLGIAEMIDQLNSLSDANDQLAESSAAAGQSTGQLVPTTRPTGPVGRNVITAKSPEQRALEESQKRILQINEEINKYRAQQSSDLSNQIQQIQINSETEIAKARAEIFSRENLKEAQAAEEFEAKRVELALKAETEIAKIRFDANKSLQDQLRTFSLGITDRELELGLARQSIGLTSQEVEKNRQLLELQKQRNAAVEAARLVKYADVEVFDEVIARIHEQTESMRQLIVSNIEYQNSFEAGWKRAFASYMDNATNASKMAESMFTSATNNMNSAIDNFVDNGKFSFGDLANSIIRDIIKIQLRASVANLLSTGANFLGFSLPGRAAGGPVSSGRPYIVGEQGPEVFIPSGSGNIIPNSRLNTSLGASGNTVVNYNIQAVDALSFKQLVARDPTFIYAVTQQGAKALPSTRR
jgi:lambda family phage tail tape measure protein